MIFAMIKVKEIVGNKINRIWEKYSEEVKCNIPPLTVEKIPDADIVFIGLNPSLSKESRIYLQSKQDKSLEFYDLDYDTGENHKYFRKFYSISKATNLSWSH
jgi:hypothetical protein